jgi:hypothetical protein
MITLMAKVAETFRIQDERSLCSSVILTVYSMKSPSKKSTTFQISRAHTLGLYTFCKLVAQEDVGA